MAVNPTESTQDEDPEACFKTMLLRLCDPESGKTISAELITHLSSYEVSGQEQFPDTSGIDRNSILSKLSMSQWPSFGMRYQTRFGEKIWSSNVLSNALTRVLSGPV